MWVALLQVPMVSACEYPNYNEQDLISLVKVTAQNGEGFVATPDVLLVILYELKITPLSY